ncbi:MAG TPA: transposase [Candidatus Kapabacteria bacterium]|jgi:REP element-mobilizing transposase RayT
MAHSYSGIYYHLIFHTKSNAVLIPRSLFEPLFAYIGGIIRKDDGVLHEAGGMPNHLHLLVTISRDVSIANAVRAIKARSSFWLSKQGVENFGWQNGYTIFSVSASIAPKVQTYIRNQEQHHRNQDSIEELRIFYERHGVMESERTIPPR